MIKPTKLVWVTYGSAAALNGILWILLFLVFPYDAPAAVLHYSQGVGIDMVGHGLNIFILPAGGLILLLMNGLLAWNTRAISPAAWWLLSLSPLVIQAMLMAAVVLLWQVNV